MAESSCSHWWHAPFYLGTAMALAFIAITSSNSARPRDDHHSGIGLAFNASRALRVQGGFHIFATLLHISPELFLSSPETTVFAIQDSAIAHLSIPPWDMRRLLRSHATSSALPMAELFQKPTGSCFKTLVDNNNLVITNRNVKTGAIMINNVLISHPDMFLQGPLTVHGVLGPFETITPQYCNSSDTADSPFFNGTTQPVDWTSVIRAVSSNGFVSFAIGLNAIVDGILQDFKNLPAVTVFAPPDSGYMASSPSQILDRFVKLHILPQKFSSMELAATENSTVKTVVPGLNLKIGRISDTLTVNGVIITAPDLSSSERFVIHGLSRDFDLSELFSSFI